MPEDDAKSPPPRRRVGPIRTAPLEDGSALREALQAELQKVVAPSLLVIAGPDVGLRVRLDRSTDIGRDPTASFALRDESISWHLRVEDRGSGEWAVVDLGSTNGTLINNQKCVGEAVLRHGDRVILGKTALEFQVADALREGFNAELERLLNQDDLSGLWVKRRFDAQLQSNVSAIAAGSLKVMSIIVMDLDGVKQINDAHGHEWGAFVIAEAGHVIGDVVGGLVHVKGAFATRFGGDEYAAALPGMSKADAVLFAEELRGRVVAHVYEKREIRVYPGMSCGVAAVPDDAPDAEGGFHAADQAMYRAKRAGKNRVAT